MAFHYGSTNIRSYFPLKRITNWILTFGKTRHLISFMGKRMPEPLCTNVKVLIKSIKRFFTHLHIFTLLKRLAIGQSVLQSHRTMKYICRKNTVCIFIMQSN